MAVTPEQARAELARRELARRQSEQVTTEPQSGAGVAGLHSVFQGAKAAADVGASALQGLAARMAAGVAAAPVMFSDPEASQQIFGDVQSKLGRPPQTQEGQQLAERIAPVGEAIETGITDFFGMVPGGPIPQTIARTAVQAPFEALALKGLTAAATPKPAAPGALIPEVKDLYSVGRVAFNEARIKGGGIKPDSLVRASDKIRNLQNDIGLKIPFDKDVHGPAFVVRERLLRDLDSGQIDFDELLTLRELAGDVAGNADRAISMRGVRMKNAIDDFVDSLGADDVLSGNPEQAAQALNSARKFWRDASVARSIEKEIELAGNRAGQFSGSGFENALRTQFRQLHARIIKGHERGFSPEEIAAIKKVVDGGTFENVSRFIGKLAPTGVVSGGIGAGGGFALFGPAGAVGVPAVGLLGRHLATRATINNARNALNTPLKSSLLDATPPVR